MKYLLLLLLFFSIGDLAVAQAKLLRKQYHPVKTSATIAEFLQEINQRSGIVLEYSSGNFDANKFVQLTGNETTVGSVLQSIMQGQRVRLIEHNNKIILIPSPDDFTLGDFLPAKYNFYGYVTERVTGEPLISATINEVAAQRGVVSNNSGYFNFALTEGKHQVEISYAGFVPVTLLLDIHDNLQKDISLSKKTDTLSTVVVASEKPGKDGALILSNEKAVSNNMLNDDDPLQFLYLSPGLQNASYSFSGFQVRGGGTDENLFLLNGTPVYNPTHLLGAISVLNPTILKSMRFYKSDFPSRFGGSLSSVLDVYTKQGNMKNWQGEVNAGLLAGSLSVEGPLVKDKVALMVSGRKNIPFSFYESLQDGITSNFYDAHFRLSAIVDSRNKLAINFYTGEDQLRQSGKYTGNLHRWGNTVGSLEWNYIPGRKSFISTSINISRYKNLASTQYSFFENDTEEELAEAEEEDEDVDETDLSLGTKFVSSFSSLENYTAKSEAEIYISRILKLNAGVSVTQSVIKPFDGKITDTEEEDEKGFLSFKPLKFEQLSIYAEPEFKISKKLFLKPGVRVSGYRFENYNTLTVQPRFYLAYRINSSLKLFGSYSRMNQFLHLVINPYAGANRNMWVPSTKYLQPGWSDIYNIGFTLNNKTNWSISMDGYYKRLTNVTNFAEGKSIFISNNNWEQNIELGKGRSYGTEIMFNKAGEKFSMLANYTLSWSWRSFASINEGKEFHYKYDHRHIANIGTTFFLSGRLDISTLWSFATGNVYTQDGVVFTDTLQQAPTGNEILEAYQFIYQYSQNNQYRAKAYQRYDASVTYHSKKGKKIYSMLKIGIYNIKGADNQYAYNLRGSLSSKSIRLRTGTSIFQIIPYFTYTLKF